MPMKKICAVLAILCLFTPLQASPLTDSSVISLLTIAPGKELYATFGHSAIRVKDEKQGLDLVFNYGTFDFNQPDFYLNFLRGRLLYMLSVDYFTDFLEMYKYEKRSVAEDILDLSPEEKQRIFEFLVFNARPENKNYRYEFFFDNCATRVRDVFEKELNEKLIYHNQGFDTTKTLRQMLDLYVEHRPWTKFGFYLILGSPTDVKATPRMQAFLPDYLQKLMRKATVQRDGIEKPLIKKSLTLLQYPPCTFYNEFLTPKMTMLLLLIIAILLSVAESAL
ncbi:MAG: DUF4105 domain-containing protein, partial [Chitinophagales bacterium]|nr:DUF4105 domain-containing protein [Chitinophagales bacterium]